MTLAVNDGDVIGAALHRRIGSPITRDHTRAYPLFDIEPDAPRARARDRERVNTPRIARFHEPV
jgi:hypothetical protein